MKKGKDDLISIIIPIYNVEKYLDRCIKSILNQTYKKYEIILVDDGSIDKCPKICDDYASKNNNIIVIHQNNQGLSDARNNGIKKAKGKYICFIDSDDYIEKEYLEKLYYAIKEDDYDYIVCNYNRVYDDKVQNCQVDRVKIEKFINPAAWNKLYKKELFENIKFPSKKYYEDLGTFPKIFLNSKNYKIIDDYLYNYVQNSDSIMKQTTDKIFDIYDIFDDLLLADKEQNIYDNLELAAIFHILIGTSYRASFHNDFSLKMIKEIKSYVKVNFPNWKKNKGIKDLAIVYKLFLFFYKINFDYIIYIALKLFHKKIKIYK